MEDDRLDLVKAGCLGTCWYGKYHYIEPWAGCSFDCAYCYARSRTNVTAKLRELETEFSKPALLVKGYEFSDELFRRVREENVEIAKLCRFTDVFNTDTVKSGASYEVLKTLLNAGVKRIIITTKGVPDGKIIDLMADNKERFSYNFVAKPKTPIQFEGKIPPLSERLEAGRQISRLGIMVTVHVDPIIPGIEDDSEVFRELLLLLKEHELKRVMFSYLLVNQEIIRIFKERFGSAVVDRLLELYETQPKQILPKQEDTCYLAFKPELRKKSIETIFELLSSMGFEYVLCGLKSGKGSLNLEKGECRRICDGTFYA